jgi:hypothetical protein
MKKLSYLILFCCIMSFTTKAQIAVVKIGSGYITIGNIDYTPSSIKPVYYSTRITIYDNIRDRAVPTSEGGSPFVALQYSSIINGTTGLAFTDSTAFKVYLRSAFAVASGGGGGGGGDASAGNQVTQTSVLNAINTKTPGLGASNTAGSSPVVIASDQVVPVFASSLPLPTGAALATNQATGNSLLSSLDGKIPVKGSATGANSTPVVIASDQAALKTSLKAKALVDVVIAVGTGVSVQIIAANSNGTGVQIYNQSATSIVWINTTGGTAIANGAGSLGINPGGSYEDIITTAVTALIASGQYITVKTY